MEAQCRGLAEALGLTPTIKRVRARAPWAWLPKQLWLFPLAAPTPDSDTLAPPWPDIVISCGSAGAAFGVGIKRASGGRTRLVNIQNPKMNPRHFDVLVVPFHDGYAPPNAIVTKLAVHPVTPTKLAEAAQKWAPRLSHLPRPLVAVLVGGANGRHRLTPQITARLADDLARLARSTGGALAVTPSRRTGAENERILRERLADVPAYMWDGQGDNPYLGLLAVADAIVVTEDSVSMTSEAISTGKPVYVARLEGESRRIRRFHEMLVAEGITRPFDGSYATWHYAVPNDTADAAARIRRQFGWS